MSVLPSLSALSLTTGVTFPKARRRDAKPYDQPTKRDDELPKPLQYNLLVLQNDPLRSAFGDDVTLLKQRNIRFEQILKAILKRRVLTPDSSMLLVNTFAPKNSAVFLNEAFNEITPRTAGVTSLSEGSWNSAYRVDPREVRFANDGDRARFVALVGEDPVALRKSKFLPSMTGQPPIQSALLELVLQSYASQTGVGPKFYLAWWTPFDEILTTPAARLLQLKVNDVVQNNCSFSELFHGDVQHFFKIRDGVFHPDMLNNNHGFWRAIGDCIVKAAKYGVFHGDLKPANMLFKLDLENRVSKYRMCYTDFDPFFVKVLDMSRREINKMQMCIGFVSLHMLITSARCKLAETLEEALESQKQGRNRVAEQTVNAIRSFPWAAVYQMAIRGFTEAYRQEHGSSLKQEFEAICAWDVSFQTISSRRNGGENDLAIKTVLTRAIDQWAYNYLQRVNGEGCKVIGDDLTFNQFAELIIDYARSGT